MCNHDNSNHQCQCHGARMERFIQPCLLLLLYENPTHGYELMESLKEFGFENGGDPGLVYRNLRKLEEEGHVTSEWKTEGAGPAKRLYSVTDDGVDLIHSWATYIQGSINRLQYFLQRYRADLCSQPEDDRE